MSASKFRAELEEAAGFIGRLKAGEAGGIEHALAHTLVNRASLGARCDRPGPDSLGLACRALAAENSLSLRPDGERSLLEEAGFAEAFAALCLALQGKTPDPTLGADRFCDHRHKPRWVRQARATALLGRFIFFRAASGASSPLAAAPQKPVTLRGENGAVDASAFIRTVRTRP